MTDPPAGDCGNSKHDRDEENALAICYSKNGRQQYEGKQNRYNNIPVFDFFDKGEKEEEQNKSNEKFHCGDPTES
jgi:hypothetical protein